MRVRRTANTRIGELIRTDRQWQTRLGPATECQCEAFRRWRAEEWGITAEPHMHEGHVWDTLDQLVAASLAEPNGPASQLRAWLWRMTTSEHGATEGGTATTPLTAIQPTYKDTQHVVAEAAGTIQRAVRHSSAMMECVTDGWRRATLYRLIRAVLQHWARGGRRDSDEELREDTSGRWSAARNHADKR